MHSLAQLEDTGIGIVILGLVIIAIYAAVMVIFVRRYKKCPPNRVLVVYGRAGGKQQSKLVHSGATFVLPIIQDYTYLSLEPLAFEAQVSTPAASADVAGLLAISTDGDLQKNAANRLLGLRANEIIELGQAVMTGSLRTALRQLEASEGPVDYEEFETRLREAATPDLNSLGLEITTLDVREATLNTSASTGPTSAVTSSPL